MRSLSCAHSARSPRRAGSRAFTLLELVIAISIMSMLSMAAMGMMMFSARQTATAAEIDQKSFNARDIIDEVMVDIAFALNFTERRSDAISFTVPDRTGDGIPESIRYAWVHDAPDPKQWSLTKEYNASEAKVLVEDVRSFELTYLLKTVGPPSE